MIMLMQAGMQANQFANMIDHAIILPKIAQAKVNFFVKTQRDLFFYFCVIRKVYQENISFVETIHIYQNISIYIKLVNIKNKAILSTCYICYT